jgi:hypothetical protein
VYKKPTVTLASGSAPLDSHHWHRLELSLHGKQIAASIDGKALSTIESADHAHGMFGLGTQWDHIQFDNVQVAQ